MVWKGGRSEEDDEKVAEFLKLFEVRNEEEDCYNDAERGRNINIVQWGRSSEIRYNGGNSTIFPYKKPSNLITHIKTTLRTLVLNFNFMLLLFWVSI